MKAWDIDASVRSNSIPCGITALQIANFFGLSHKIVRLHAFNLFLTKWLMQSLESS